MPIRRRQLAALSETCPWVITVGLLATTALGATGGGAALYAAGVDSAGVALVVSAALIPWMQLSAVLSHDLLHWNEATVSYMVLGACLSGGGIAMMMPHEADRSLSAIEAGVIDLMGATGVMVASFLPRYVFCGTRVIRIGLHSS